MTRLARKEIGPLAALLVAAVLILAFGFLAVAVQQGDTAAFDRAVMLALRSDVDPADPIGSPLVEEIVRDVTALGSYTFIGFIFLSVLGYLVLIRNTAAVTFVAAAVFGGAALNTILKQLIDRARPDLVPHAAQVFTASFPSAHATVSAVTFLTLGALVTRVHAKRRIKIYVMAIAVILTVLVGLSRLYLGVHYPTDVIAGWAVGAGWAILCWGVAGWLQQRRGRHPPVFPPPRDA